MDVIKACTCGVCLELFTDPRMMPCGHTYCQKCIEPLLEGAMQKSAQCPECRSKNKQSAKGFPVNYGILGMVDHVEASTGTRSIGTCNSCAKGASMTDLFSCMTCKENSATAVDAKFLVCAMCIAKTHKGHDYKEPDVLSKKDIEEALQKVQACREACGAKKKTVHDVVAAIERLKNMLAEREAALATIADDLSSGNALTKPQLVDKVKECEKIEKDLEESDFATAFAALKKCHRDLGKIPALLQQNTGAPEADTSVLIVDASDSTAPPPVRRRRMSTAARATLSRSVLLPQTFTRQTFTSVVPRLMSDTRQERLAATPAQAAETSVVVVEDDDAVAPRPSRRGSIIRCGRRLNRND